MLAKTRFQIEQKLIKPMWRMGVSCIRTGGKTPKIGKYRGVCMWSSGWMLLKHFYGVSIPMSYHLSQKWLCFLLLYIQFLIYFFFLLNQINLLRERRVLAMDAYSICLKMQLLWRCGLLVFQTNDVNVKQSHRLCFVDGILLRTVHSWKQEFFPSWKQEFLSFCGEKWEKQYPKDKHMLRPK